MRTIGDDIRAEYQLAKIRKRGRLYVASDDGLRLKEKATGTKLLYCPTCKAPVVDNPRSREIHAQRSERCRKAMEEK